MSDLTVGAFLVIKMHNMHLWLHREGIKNILLSRENSIDEVRATMLASKLAQFRDDVSNRNWKKLAEISELPTQLKLVLKEVEERSDLHDKFWRYLSLFVDTVSDTM